MHPANDQLILSRLSAGDVVLDIGGWARPFNRANYVIDQESYETRGHYGLPAQGGQREHFSSATWIRRDLCTREPYPFADKSIDFVICSHTLEDLRDPLWVCSEIVRIGRAGYLEVPSRIAESSRGIEPGQVGWSHHRWLIDFIPAAGAAPAAARFMMKYHKIHSHWRLSLPPRFLRRLPPEGHVQWLFWDDTFQFSETIVHGAPNIEAELARFVERVRPYPRARLAADRWLRTAGWYLRRARDKAAGRG